ncbi:MAG: transcription-repair coupling factor [Chloroflexi bacterium]|nr:transcription-repair coupling factor [Chloroflexota bacterium]MCL5275803.1 transcription-repair coupling factor [Chloroflexota bacterium]
MQARAIDASRGVGLLRAARPLLVAALKHELQRPIVYLVSSVEGARTTFDALRSLALTGSDAATAPADILRSVEPNTAFYDTVAPVIDVTVQRSVVLAALYQCTLKAAAAETSPVIVTSPRALMHPTLPPAIYRAAIRTLRRDQPIALETTLAQWVAAGYENESVVERIGAFSRRGGIIDVWSPAHALPARIELFGNQIESIRLFDPGTQRSGEMIDRLLITPLESMVVDTQPARQATLLDYLGDEGLLVIDDEEELRDAWTLLEAKAERERETVRVVETDTEEDRTETPNTRPVANVHDQGVPFITWDGYRMSRGRLPRVLVLGQPLESRVLTRHALAEHFTAAPHFAGQLNPVMEYLHSSVAVPAEKDSQDAPANVVVISRQAGRLAELWSERNSVIAPQSGFDEAPADGLSFVTGALPEGFIFTEQVASSQGSTAAFGRQAPPSLILITDAEIFGYVRPESWQFGRARKAAPERAFADWQTGDVVVHEDYGIGIFRGLVRLTVNTGTLMEPAEGEREYLLLEYSDADRLYVPLHQLDRVSRYVGSDESRPTLSKLGATEWVQVKQKARGAAAQVARDMLQLYAAREMAQGVALSKDTPWQAELEASFPYMETDDQLRAIQDVKRDLEHTKPMDRLVCGDVGFGKTEVALRAAFKAVQDDFQVAVLAPTTVLAQQHWMTFTRRMASYPIKVEMLSRFRTSAEKHKVVDGIREGAVDIVIGTHALLSNNVQFANLGLLIIDEEQRFGAAAKEKLKKMRASVHVMTLTATPIPRTLYFGLTGIRDVSRIETPPAERLPIISYVGPFDDTIVKQSIQRELDREGQVFFVHNRINSIHLLETKLRRLAPEASIAVAHGQMEERALARIMNEFADGRTDILLSTNIVESGLDISNANTIIIDRADHFGLADLYQLRGRVGRSTTQAYAYFLYDRRTHMTVEARERLETLREAAGIGAGYMIAMRDLELRGAGDILGPRQSGQVASIGLDLYTRLLAREVSTLRALRDGTALPAPEPTPVTIDLPLTIGLPQNYIGDQPLRLQMYRRVASLDTEEKIRLFEEELADRFGKLPQAVLNLTYQARLKLFATALGAQSITTEGNRFVIRAESIEKLDRNAVARLLGEDANIGRRQVSFLRSGPPEVWKARLMQLIEQLAEMATVAGV